MSRFILKPLKWIWSVEVGTPYDPPVNGNTARILDPALPRVGEIFMDKQGVLYTHVIKDGNHEYVKCSGSGNSASSDGEVLKARTPLNRNGQIKSDSTIVDVTSLDNVYVAALISGSGTKKVLLGDFNDVLNNRSDAFIEACTVESDATRVFITRSAFGIVILVFGATSGLKLYALNSAAGATGERYIEKSIDLPSGVTFTSILQISEEGHFLAACGLTSPYVFLVDLSNPDNIFTETRITGNVTFAKTISKVKQSFCPFVKENEKVLYYAKNSNGSLLKIVYSNGTLVSQVVSDIDFDDGFEVGTKFFVHKTASNEALFDGNTSVALGFNIDLGTVIDDIDYQASNKRDGEIENNASFTAIRSIGTANTDCVFASFFNDLSNAPGNEDKNAYVEHVTSLTGLTKDIIYLGHGFIASVNDAKAYSFNIGFIEAFKHIEAAEVSSRFTSVVSTDKARKTVMNPSANDAGNGKFIDNKSTFSNTEVGEEVHSSSAKSYLHSNENGTSSIESIVDSSSSSPYAKHEIKRGENSKVTSVVDTNSASIREGTGNNKYFEVKSDANGQNAKMVNGNTEIHLREERQDSSIIEAVGNGWDTVFGSVATTEEAKSYLGSGADSGTQSYTYDGTSFSYKHRSDPVFVEQTAVVGSNKRKAGAVYNAVGSGNPNNESAVSIDASGGTGSNFYARNTVRTKVANGYESIVTNEATGTGNTATTKHSLINTSNVEVSTVKEEVKATESVVETRHVYTYSGNTRIPVARMRSTNNLGVMEIIPNETGTSADNFDKSILQVESGKSLFWQRCRNTDGDASLAFKSDVNATENGGFVDTSLREGNTDSHAVDMRIDFTGNEYDTERSRFRTRTIGNTSGAYVNIETRNKTDSLHDYAYANIELEAYGTTSPLGTIGYTNIGADKTVIQDSKDSYDFRTVLYKKGLNVVNTSYSRSGTLLIVENNEEYSSGETNYDPLILTRRFLDSGSASNRTYTNYDFGVERRPTIITNNSESFYHSDNDFVAYISKQNLSLYDKFADRYSGFNDEGFATYSFDGTALGNTRHDILASMLLPSGLFLMTRKDSGTEVRERVAITSNGIIKYNVDQSHPFKNIIAAGHSDFTKTDFDDPSLSVTDKGEWSDVINSSKLVKGCDAQGNCGSNTKFVYVEGHELKAHTGKIGNEYSGSMHINSNGEFAANETSVDVVVSVNLDRSSAVEMPLYDPRDSSMTTYGSCYLLDAEIFYNGISMGKCRIPSFNGDNANKLRYYPSGAKCPAGLTQLDGIGDNPISNYKDMFYKLARLGSRLKVYCYGTALMPWTVLWFPTLDSNMTYIGMSPEYNLEMEIVSWSVPVSVVFGLNDTHVDNQPGEVQLNRSTWHYFNDARILPLVALNDNAYQAIYSYNMRMHIAVQNRVSQNIGVVLNGDVFFYGATPTGVSRSVLMNLPSAGTAYPFS